MLPYLKQQLKNLFQYAITIASCVTIIVLGISILSRAADPVTTTIGENITTNDLLVVGNATSTGIHYFSTNAIVNGNIGIGTSSPYARLSVAGEAVAGYFHATTTTATSTFSGRLLITKTPVAHTFAAAWAEGVDGSNVLDSSLVVNPATSPADGNVFGIAVGNSVKFIIDAEGDVFANNLTLAGSENVGESTISTLIVENNSTLGDAIGDLVTFESGSIIFNNTATSTIQQNINAWSIATSTTATPILSIDGSSGYLGIGTDAPDKLLDLKANYTGGELIHLDRTDNADINDIFSIGVSYISNIADDFMYFGVEDNAYMVIQGASTGFVGILDNEPDAHLEVSANGGSGGAVIMVSSNNDNDGDLFIVNEDGNVGIGTTSPYAKLSVVGETVAEYFTATSTTATSTVAGGLSAAASLYGLQNGNVGIGTSMPTTVIGLNKFLEIEDSLHAGIVLHDTSVNPWEIYVDGGYLVTVYNGTEYGWVLDSAGNLGVGTTSPYAKLSVWGAGTSGAEAFNVIDSASTTLFSILDSGTVSIATSSPFSHALFSVGNTIPSLFVDNNTGYVGIGSSTPWGRFSIEQADDDQILFIVGDQGTTTPHMKIDGSGITTINQLQTGAMSFDTNAGVVSWANLPVTNTNATGTVQSMTAQIDYTNILTVYAEEDGSGGIQNPSVGIGTTSPLGVLAVAASSTSPALYISQINSTVQGPVARFFDGGTEV
jgi:hypothetical protein